MWMIIGIDRWGRRFEIGPQLTLERAQHQCYRMNLRSYEMRSGCVYSITQVLDV